MRINRKLKLAFIMDGNLGSILIRTNLIKAITELFDRDKIEVYFFAHPKQNISETIFKGLDFIDYIKKRTEIKESIYKDFDLVVRCETFPLLLHYNKRKIYKTIRTCS